MATDIRAFGNFTGPQLPFIAGAGGVNLPFGQILPPTGGQVFYVHSSGAAAVTDPEMAKNVVTTLDAALRRCTANRHDTIFVLPNHTENVSTATAMANLVAGTRIIGLGSGTSQPVFRWTATAAQWAIAVANVTISNLHLKMEGANGVVKALVSTAAEFTLESCRIQVASGASNKATIAIEIGSAALFNSITGNRIYGTETHNVTDLIKVVGGTTPDDLVIANNIAIASATAANGLIHVTVACKRLAILNNVLYNTHTASSATIAFDAVAADGMVHGNASGVINNGTAASSGFVPGGSATVKGGQNWTSDESGRNGALSPAAPAT